MKNLLGIIAVVAGVGFLFDCAFSEDNDNEALSGNRARGSGGGGDHQPHPAGPQHRVRRVEDTPAVEVTEDTSEPAQTSEPAPQPEKERANDASTETPPARHD